MNIHPAARRALRERPAHIMVVAFPLATAAQFVGHRPVAEIALSLVILAFCLAVGVHSALRDARNHIEWEAEDRAREAVAAARMERLVAAQDRLDQLMREADARRAARDN